MLPESADDLCNSQMLWYQGVIENNMLKNYNENSCPDKIFFFPVKINAGLVLSAIQLLVSSQFAIYDFFLYTSVS